MASDDGRHDFPGAPGAGSGHVSGASPVVPPRSRAELTHTDSRGEVRMVDIDDKAAIEALQVMRRRRGGGEELLAWKDGTTWRDLYSEEVPEELLPFAAGQGSN